MRIFVFPKDVMVLTGYSEGYSRSIIRTIKKQNGKDSKDKVTYVELATRLKITTDEIIKALSL